MTAALAALDLILAKALYADSLQAIRPELNADGVLDLVDARHPLLVEQGKVVGIDVQLGGDFRVLVVTGPNTGGKTVTLKTIGLLTAMAACGLAIPADRGRLPVVRRIFADIGDEQSIAQSLSTFSSHLRNVVATLAEAERGDLALLDEVGAGTDPDEGAALAMAVLETLLERGVLAAATTHYPELKAFALNTPGVRNASMEFDANTLRPTFRLRLGLPGASNAFAIAERLGLDKKVLGRADTHLGELHRSLERTLLEAERQRTELTAALEEARVSAADAAQATSGAQHEADRVRDEAQRRKRATAPRNETSWMKRAPRSPRPSRYGRPRRRRPRPRSRSRSRSVPRCSWMASPNRGRFSRSTTAGQPTWPRAPSAYECPRRS